MQPKNPDYHKAIEHGFSAAAFVNDLGITLIDCGPGWCESRVDISARHLQHGGIVQAGVQATIADHTTGAAATTLLAPGEFVVTVDFNIHLLRPASGEALVCRAQVLKPGAAVSVVEAEVFCACGRRTFAGEQTFGYHERKNGESLVSHRVQESLHATTQTQLRVLRQGSAAGGDGCANLYF